MKKILSLLVGALLVNATGFALPNASVLLQHEGNIVVYPSDSLQTALHNAVDGDTLFLSKGKFPGFTIDKKLTIRGEGQETQITGQITVSIPDSVTLTSTLLEGLKFLSFNNYDADNNYSVWVTTPLNGLKVKQCFFNTIAFERTMREVTIDRCRINEELLLSAVTRSLTANNCRIKCVKFPGVSSKEITFINCNILRFSEFEHFRGTAINSITGYGRTGSYVTFHSCSFINSLICTYRLTVDNTCYTENCWYYSTDTKLVNDNSFTCVYSDEELLEMGYIGNDGTIVGSNGGATPYTLELAVPYVKSSDIKLNSDKQILNVNLILSAE